MSAYQDAGFAYQGTGDFAYQTIAVPVSPGVDTGGGGGGGWIQYGKRPRRKRPLEELFNELEQSIREQLLGPAVTVSETPVIPAKVADSVADKFDELVRLADESQELQARLNVLRQDLDEYHLMRLIDDDDEWVMMHG
jgi:hypothetical protein